MDTEYFSKIGTDLVGTSKEAKRTPGEILQELFPYVYEASRRMSARQISKWLEEKHGIQISQPTISRALRDPNAFEEWYAENIEPTARRVASSFELPLEDLLFDDSTQGSYQLALAEDAAKERMSREELADVREGIKYLAEAWFTLSIGTRRACYPEKLREEGKEERSNDGN